MRQEKSCRFFRGGSGVRITWQGTDITGYVIVRKAVARDTCGGRCDGLDIAFENAEDWYRWGPEEDDEIQIEADGWESGTLYLNTVAPGERKYRVIATALPCAARKKEWRSYEGKRIEEIARQCAAMTGMDWRGYGIDGTIQIPYIQQENEGAAAFLHKLATLEGAKLKCVNGRFTLISLEWAQERNPVDTLQVSAEQTGADYRRSGATLRGVRVITPYATGEATDDHVDSRKAWLDITDLPAMNDIQAARWARNILTEKNTRCESLTINASFSPAWTAMARIDITGGTDADGSWIIEDVEHDLIRGSSRATLRRCIQSIR